MYFKNMNRFRVEALTNHANSHANISSSDKNNQLASHLINVGVVGPNNNDAHKGLVGEAFVGSTSVPTQDLDNKEIIVELVVLAMDELIILKFKGLWIWVYSN